MPRNLIALIALVFSASFTGQALADEIGLGEPGANDQSSTQSVTTDDEIGIGNESWYDIMLDWF